MKLTIGGIIFLVLAWGSVIVLTVYCFAKVLRPKNKVKGNTEQIRDR